MLRAAALLLSALAAPLTAGAPATWQPTPRTARYECRVFNPGTRAATDIEVVVPLPVPSPRQQIHYLRHRAEGLRETRADMHGQRLLHCRIDRLEPGGCAEFGFVVGATLRNAAWPPPDASPPCPDAVLAPAERAACLAPQPNYSMDAPVMAETAAALTRCAAGDYQKLVRIHDHILARVRYARDDHWDPAAVVLTRGTGSCSEYNYLLSGLCRLAGLPTRAVGGSICPSRQLPATDAVFHRWTEVHLTGYGWFPVDCSRDSNPLRGPRNSFGRVHHDALVWSRQAGGDPDSLGWEYRANVRVRGHDPGLLADHRTRWLPFTPEPQLAAAEQWFLTGTGGFPAPDLLECALLRWPDAPPDARVRIVQALAAAGRGDALLRAAMLPPEPGPREPVIRQLCDPPALADALAERARQPRRFRSWFRDHEARLAATGDGRFRLPPPAPAPPVPEITGPATAAWAALTDTAAGRLAGWKRLARGATVVVAPPLGPAAAGLPGAGAGLHDLLTGHLASLPGVKLLDWARFDRFMTDHGPGRGEYWQLANRQRPLPAEAGIVPDCVLVPVCVAQPAADLSHTLCTLDLRALDLTTRRSFTATARARHQHPPQPAPPHDVLVAGGDAMLGRWQHDHVQRHGPAQPLAGLAPILSAADAALCNLECAVSRAGSPAPKGERCPFHYRARPEMLPVLTDAGVDIVTAANNHAGDYGPAAVLGTARWCRRAGLVCAGIGADAAAAETPRLVLVGRTRVGVAGLDATLPRFAAAAGRAGTSHCGADDLAGFSATMHRLGQWAHGRCDLLLLTVHWGANWAAVPPPRHRELARLAFAAGVDVILGHSAHQLQGIEVVDGKPVVYDMGNLLFDCALKPDGRRAALFRLHLSPAGVHRIEVLPALALAGRSVPAAGADARQILAGLLVSCANLGTRLDITTGTDGRPLGAVDIAAPQATRRPAPDRSLPCASFPLPRRAITPAVPAAAVQQQLPGDVAPLPEPATLAPGVELLAFRLPPSATQGRILGIDTWWRVTGPVDPGTMVAFELRIDGKTGPRGTPTYTRHDAADWSAPLHLLQPGQIVHDHHPARLAGLPAGRCMVHALLVNPSQPAPQPPPTPARHLGCVTILPTPATPAR